MGKIYGSNIYIWIFKNNIAMVSLSISLLVVYFTFQLQEVCCYMLLLKLPVMAKAWKVTVTGRNSQGHLMISLQVPHWFSNTPYTQKLFSLKLLFIVYLFYSSEYFKNLNCSRPTIILFGNTLTGSFKLLTISQS